MSSDVNDGANMLNFMAFIFMSLVGILMYYAFIFYETKEKLVLVEKDIRKSFAEIEEHSSTGSLMRIDVLSKTTEDGSDIEVAHAHIAKDASDPSLKSRIFSERDKTEKARVSKTDSAAKELFEEVAEKPLHQAKIALETHEFTDVDLHRKKSLVSLEESDEFTDGNSVETDAKGAMEDLEAKENKVKVSLVEKEVADATEKKSKKFIAKNKKEDRKIVQLEANDAQKWGFSVHFKSGYQNWKVIQVLEGHQAFMKGIEVGNRVALVNGTEINEANSADFEKLLRRGEACMIEFENVFAKTEESLEIEPAMIGFDKKLFQEVAQKPLQHALIALQSHKFTDIISHQKKSLSFLEESSDKN